MYLEYHSICPLVRIGILPTPFLQTSVPPAPFPQGTKGGGGTTLARGWGVGEVPIRTTGEKA